MIKVAESKEYLDVMDWIWGWPVGNGGDAFWVHLDAIWGDDETQEPCFFNMKFTFFQLNIQTAVKEALKNRSDMLNVILQGTVSVDEDIVKVSDTGIV